MSYAKNRCRREERVAAKIAKATGGRVVRDYDGCANMLDYESPKKRSTTQAQVHDDRQHPQGGSLYVSARSVRGAERKWPSGHSTWFSAKGAKVKGRHESVPAFIARMKRRG